MTIIDFALVLIFILLVVVAVGLLQLVLTFLEVRELERGEIKRRVSEMIDREGRN